MQLSDVLPIACVVLLIVIALLSMMWFVFAGGGSVSILSFALSAAAALIHALALILRKVRTM